MVNNITFCINPTTLFTWISTFLINTSFVMWTFLAHDTFWSTKWWTSNIVCTTWAYWTTLFYLAHWIRTTWWRLAWVSRNFWFIISFCKNKKKIEIKQLLQTYIILNTHTIQCSFCIIVVHNYIINSLRKSVGLWIIMWKMPCVVFL